MSFSKESFTKKLSVLQDTQESIVSISQWVFFHHRHAKECAKIWADYTLATPSSSSASAKKLCLLYLCNDVVQRAKRKRKQEFIDEFAHILPSVIEKTYGTLDNGTRPKLDRLINVWQERTVFSISDIQKMKAAVESVKSNVNKEKIEQSSQSKATSSGEIVPELKHLNELIISLNHLSDISQANLTQFGIQSKTYLPADPSKSDKLPSPKVYISKLNMLEKLSKLSIVNIEELKSIKKQIAKQLDSLSSVISEGCKTDDTKISIINDKLGKLYNTREELQSLVNEDGSKKEEEEPSASIDNGNTDDPYADDDDDDMLPTYESDDDDEDERKPDIPVEEPKEEPTRKRRASQTPSGGSTPSKRVAFSEDIEVKEFDREDSEVAIADNIDYSSNGNDDGEEEFEVSNEFELHHKDDLELKHEHNPIADDDDDDGYDPSIGDEISAPTDSNNEDSSSSSSADVMSLLSKLA